MTRTPDKPCTGCGKMCWRAKGRAENRYPKDKPQLCWDCRRTANTLTCTYCAETFVRDRSHRRAADKRGLNPYCSKGCCTLARATNGPRYDDLRRAQTYGVAYEKIDVQRVYERDNWRCGICRKKVDKRLVHPHPMRASLDHIVPLSKGGDHLYENVQCSHLRCNLDKSNKGGGEQLCLIG